MFNIGDKVICINNDNYKDVLKIGDTYIIHNIDNPDGDITYYDIGHITYFKEHRFILLNKYREEKLKRILCT